MKRGALGNCSNLVAFVYGLGVVSKDKWGLAHERLFSPSLVIEPPVSGL